MTRLNRSRPATPTAQDAGLRETLEWIAHACDMSLEVMRETFGSEQRLLIAVIPSKIAAALAAPEPQREPGAGQ